NKALMSPAYFEPGSISRLRQTKSPAPRLIRVNGDEASMADQSFEHLQVLIVEDNKHMRALLNAMLSVAGIRHILEAASGEAGLEVLRNNACDIVFTDMSMKPMDGLAFTRALRNDAASPNHFVPIIMITGHTERHRVEQARDAGVTEFLAKPVTAANLFS